MLTGLCIFFVAGVLCWAVLWRNSSLLYPTVSHGDRTGNRIALTFDDGPHPAYTPRALDVLAKHGVKATFFCLGCFAGKHTDVVRRIHGEGHLAANHGFDHSLRDFLRPPGSVHGYIMRSGATIQGLVGYFPRFYRPTVGVKTPPRALSAYRLGVTCAGWSRRAGDGGSLVLAHAKALSLAEEMRAGDILLLHDGRVRTNGTMDLEYSEKTIAEFAESLEALVVGLQNRGFELVRLDHLLGVPPGIEIRSALAGKVSGWGLIKNMLAACGQEKASPAWLGVSLGVGVLVGCSPFFGLHAFMAIVLALRFRLHKLAVLAGTGITTPPLTPLIIYGCLQTGWWTLYGGHMPMSLETLKSIGLPELLKQFLLCWVVGFLLFGAGLACAMGAVLYAGLSLRRWIRTPARAGRVKEPNP